MGPQNSERSVDPSNFSKISVLNFRKKYRLRDLKKKIKLLIKTVPTVTVTVVTEKQFQLGTVSEKQLRLTLQLGTVSEKQIQFPFQVVTGTEKQIRVTFQLGTGTEKQLQNRYDSYVTVFL